ncbi:MAG TPA: TAT-variant-translocated molybdopterin oxidoreductase [Terriglobales bacterium]|nr:TAT-variant-translocated molybdopterin oxidoreductase [Terriglobales bacterium]
MELIQIKTGQTGNNQSGKGSGQPLDIKTVQQKLSAAQGPEYWRSLEELAGTPEFEDLLHREFPRQASEWVGDNVSRRNFLQLMSASLALAGLSGCTKMPTQKIVPYVRQPEEIVLGRPQYYATAFTLNGCAHPVLACSYQGRPTKIEGNPEHPASKGAADLFAQGSVLDLYDPDRSQVNLYQGNSRPWDAVLAGLAAPLASQMANDGSGLRLLTRTVNSPTLASQIKALQQRYPQMKWVQYEPVNRSSAYAGAQMAFGEPVEVRYNLANADVIVSLDADFLYSGQPGMEFYSSDFANRRDANEKANPKGLNRLYVVEGTATTTGFKADHRLPVKPSEVEGCARYLAMHLVTGGGGDFPGPAGPWLDVVARDLQAHKGRAVVIAGEFQPPVVHALAHAMNEALGAVGSTVTYSDPIIANTADQNAALKELVGEMNAGKVDLLVIAGPNPVYEAPADLNFADALKKVALKVHHGMFLDETGLACNWHISATHYLEEWSDARAITGEVTIVQPLIAPLYGSHSVHELVAVLAGQANLSSYDLVRSYWQSQNKGANFEDFWRLSIHNGFIDGSALPPKAVKVKSASFPSQAASSQGVEVAFRPDPSIWDGRFSNNGWLQELPKPLTKVVWDNVVMVSPKMAKDLGFPADQNTYIAQIEYHGQKIRGPVWVQAGHPDDAVTVYFGYGRDHSGKWGTDRGYSAYSGWVSGAGYIAQGARVTRLDERYKLASTQGSQLIGSHNMVRATSLEEFKRNPDFAHDKTEAPRDDETLYPGFPYPSEGPNGDQVYKWGMSIDLNRCTGCNACIVACVAENNTPIVGYEQCLRGRHMHWLRVDVYYQGDLANPRGYYQPLPCMQCENAPCELVCPVGATVHSTEGLNDMVYNRCVGTRYCSNNCPYKVRRFNFLLFQDWTTPQYKLVRNPEVTVRSRGVMEKCTYCIQRITNGRIIAEEDSRRVKDGEILTACQQTCPTQAIVFGDLHTEGGRVAQLKAESRDYGVLEELNTRPRTSYLAAVLNPNPEIPAPQPEQHIS